MPVAVARCRHPATGHNAETFSRKSVSMRAVFLPPCVAAALLAGACAAPCPAADGAADRADPAGPTFEGDVRRVFKTHCLHCHGEAGHVEGGLDLRLVRLMTGGGDSGPAVDPGDAEFSYLMMRLDDGSMPPAEVTIRPTAAEVTLVRDWIDAGARTARPEPDDPADLPRVLPEDREHWAYRPVDPPDPPAVSAAGEARVRTPVDRFVLAELESMGRTFAPDADRRTLLRRATFDLTGLPPTPAELDAFLADARPDAYERLVDRLLASPAYGVRWGRHWLDVAGYADTEGAGDADAPRPFAWKYRDYVVESLNRDVPLDEFLTEQIAGDELVTSPLTDPTPADRRRLIATGFLRNAPDGTGQNPDDPTAAKNQVVADTIDIVSSSLLGLTVACAQCHDHRYDAITHEDYHRLRAVLEPALDPKDWRTPAGRRLDLAAPELLAARAAARERVAAAERRVREKQDEAVEVVFRRELVKVPEALRADAEAARSTPEGERTDAQRGLLEDYPSLLVSPGTLHLYLELFEGGEALAGEIAGRKAAVAAAEADVPAFDSLRPLVEPRWAETGGEPPTTYLFHRGDPSQPRDPVPPGGLTVTDHLLPVIFPENDPAVPTTGRRLALARHLTDPRHPLVSRVLANRVWMHHFGRGLVATPAEFGVRGAPPTHPGLLDWLARDLVANGWRLKRVHRLLMTSTAYRQSSVRADPDFDPGNRWLARQSVKRLEAEAVRDAILAVSGGLSGTAGGAPSAVDLTDAGARRVAADVGAGASPRSMFVRVGRTAPADLLATFDAPRVEPNCTRRTASTVAPQSLTLMNDPVVVARAAAFAARVDGVAGPDPADRVRAAWRVAYAADPTGDELAAALAFLADQTAHFESVGPAGDDPAPADLEALAGLCQALIGSNRFLYID